MKIVLCVIVVFSVSQGLAYHSAFIRDCLEAHNAVRAQHGVPALDWSAEIAVSAQKWANHLAAIDQLQHDSSTSYGENLFYMYGGDPSQACDRAVQNWYQEEKNFNFRSPHLDDSTSHFSQLIWRDSKSVGIGTAQSKSGNFFLVARYNPRGNVDDQLIDNVPGVIPQALNHNDVSSGQTAEDEHSNSHSTKDHNLVHFKLFHINPTAETPESSARNPSHHKDENGPESRLNDRPEQGQEEPGPTFLPHEPNKAERTGPSYQTMEMSKTKKKPNYAKEVYGLPVTTSHNAETQENVANETPFLTGLKQDETNVRPIYALSGTKEKTQYLTGSVQTETKVRPSYSESDQSETTTSLNNSGLDGNPTNVRPADWGTKPTLGYDRQDENNAKLNNFTSLQVNDQLYGPVKEPFAIKYVPMQMVESKPKPSYSFSHVSNMNGFDANLLMPHFSDARVGFGPAPLVPVGIVTPKRGKEFKVEIRFTGITFTSQMEVPGSQDFEDIKRNLTLAIIVLYDDDDDFQEVQLISIRNGSVIATLGLIFKTDVPGHLDRLTKALQTGRIGNYPVALAYEAAVALPAGYLKPRRVAQQPGIGVCAQPCSQPNHCYPSGCTVACCAFHPHERPHPGPFAAQGLPTCSGTCDDSCYPDCDEDCCSDLLQPSEVLGSNQTPVTPSMICPGSCHFSCYPHCSPECCENHYVSNPCHESCPAYCAPTCDNSCCSTRKSLVNSLSRQYSRYRSAQRSIARQFYLRRHSNRPTASIKRLKPVRPVRRMNLWNLYRGRSRPDDPSLEDYDRSFVYSSKRAGPSQTTQYNQIRFNS